MEEKISLEKYQKGYREIRIEEEKRGFLIHLVVYVLVNIMLMVINFLYTPGFFWFFYPLLGWGIGIAVHYLFSVLWMEKILEEKEAKAEYRAKKM